MSEQQRVREGDSVTIECVARGVPSPGVSITKYEDLQVTPTPRDSADNRTSEVGETSEVGSIEVGWMLDEGLGGLTRLPLITAKLENCNSGSGIQRK